jgi:hypothetical protein
MSRLALIEEPVSRPQLETAIASALADENTLIFLDTSLLIWVYSLHEAARQELIDWLLNGRPEGSVKVPRRVAHEFSRHRRNDTVLMPFKGVSTVPKLVRQLQRWAHLVADDTVAQRAGFADRAAYLAQLDAVNAQIGNLIKPIQNVKHVQKVDTDLTPVINQLAMSGDIFTGIEHLQRQYEARAEVRMPPGFRDAKKKGQGGDADAEPALEPETHGANRFGDFAIWNEILTSLEPTAPEAGPRPSAVMIITHDVKDDWSYTPMRIIDVDGKTKNNEVSVLRVTVAQPMLAHELFVRTGIETLHIINAPQLARIATRHGIGTPLEELARAAQVEELTDIENAAEIASDDAEVGGEGPQVPDLADQPIDATDAQAEIEGEEEVPAEPAPAPMAEEPAADAAAFLANLPGEVSADRTYLGDPLGDPNMEKVIADLKSSSWYTQNPAAERGMKLLRDGLVSLKQAFIFGRNIYQAACGSANEPIGILSNLATELEEIPVDRAVIFYAGALCEAYFDKQGQPRRRPKAAKIADLFGLQRHPRYAQSVAWLQAALAPHAEQYLALPSADPPIRQFRIVFAADDAQRVEAIMYGDIPLTEPFDIDTNGDPLPPRAQHQRLSQRISRHFAIPESQFTLLPGYEEPVSFGELQLRDWGIATAVTW